jgi:hypothetical protein
MGRFRRSGELVKLGGDTCVFGTDVPAAGFAPKRARSGL